MSFFRNAEHDVDAEQAQELLRERDAQIIDVREPHEHEAGHIPNDTHFPMEYVALEAASIDQERPVIFYCRVGQRSALVVEAFRAAGWEAYNLRGGLTSWVDAGQTIEPPDGSVAGH